MKIDISYNGNSIAQLEGGDTATIECAGHKMEHNLIVIVPEIVDSPLPIEISTEAEMTALLETAEVGSVYKYTGATGTYESDVLYVVEEEEVNLISFTIVYDSYQAEDGMNWEQWVNSSYNTDGYFSSGASVINNAGAKVAFNGVNVTPTELIKNGQSYSLNGEDFE